MSELAATAETPMQASRITCTEESADVSGIVCVLVHWLTGILLVSRCAHHIARLLVTAMRKAIRFGAPDAEACASVEPLPGIDSPRSSSRRAGSRAPVHVRGRAGITRKARPRLDGRVADCEDLAAFPQGIGQGCGHPQTGLHGREQQDANRSHATEDSRGRRY